MENKNEQIPLSDGGKIMLNIVKDELFPLQNDLKNLLLDTQKCRISLPFYSKKLNSLENKYFELSIKFFDIVRKLETPDILFKGLKDDPLNIANYFQFHEAISKNINEGSKYIEIIDRTLDRKKEIIQNFRTLILAFVAIIISIISII
jgi:hypothetical protein